MDDIVSKDIDLASKASMMPTNNPIKSQEANNTVADLSAFAEMFSRERQRWEIFRETVSEEIESLRGMNASQSTVIELLSALERIRQEMSRLKRNHEREMDELMSFRRTTNDELQRVWDNVNELTEVTNVTSRHLEDIYEKDIQALQNFQTQTEAALVKLRSDLDGAAEGVWKAPYPNTMGADSNESLDAIRAEIRSLGQDLGSTKEAHKYFTDQIQRVFEDIAGIAADIDGLKKDRREGDQEREILQRQIKSLEQENIAEIVNTVSEHNRMLEELNHFKSQAGPKLDRGHGEEKLSLVVTEIQNLKSQIYYLQQSVIHLRSSPAVPNVVNGSVVSSSRLPNPGSENCLDREVFDNHLRDEESVRSSVVDRVSLLEESVASAGQGITDANDKLSGLRQRVEKIEENEKKYNLIVKGIEPEVTCFLRYNTFQMFHILFYDCRQYSKGLPTSRSLSEGSFLRFLALLTSPSTKPPGSLPNRVIQSQFWSGSPISERRSAFSDLADIF